jgi:hypothetical protein
LSYSSSYNAWRPYSFYGDCTNVDQGCAFPYGLFVSRQFFGEVNIDAQSRDLTVDQRDINGVSVFIRTSCGHA